ncbi:TPA: type IV pilus twitching motility protein PilT [Klebsiella pneumoniae]|nr:type IV pilus twitching motility protein PilT [Klebsiella pneumoniae subsp. pneumoniae]HDY8831047.1 type IV pilus twitching motility protein PilT [Klebsiella pneumoniae]
MKLEEIVALSVKHNVSDLHLCNSAAPRWRRQGRLEPAPFPAPDIANLLNDWLDAAQLLHWQEHGQIDFALNLACGARLRASAFAHTRGISLVLRLLPEQCPRLDMLGAPPALSELLAEESGLLLVTGATGSGKSTTLAAMVGHLNQHLDGHILTLEDPVEFIHHSERCLIQQREVGRHCPSFAAALRVALRQDPDVILLGELRDSETIRLALTAAETGHLVMATLHTRGAAPAVEKDQVRSQLAGSLCAVLAQKLLPARQGGRVALYELLVNTPAVANLIREGKVHQLPGVMQTGMQAGMLTFTQSFQQRVAAGAL